MLVPNIVAAILGDNLPGHVTARLGRLMRRLDGRSSEPASGDHPAYYALVLA
jgi:hypothetical protein